ncbi:hypothetical protein RvY_04672, partial [Ramazzottius varieornatus]
LTGGPKDLWKSGELKSDKRFNWPVKFRQNYTVVRERWANVNCHLFKTVHQQMFFTKSYYVFNLASSTNHEFSLSSSLRNLGQRLVLPVKTIYTVIT